MPVKYILFLIVFSQFCCTSLWFAGNAVVVDLATANDLSTASIVSWTIAVQLGFILGTLLTAIFLIADRFSPSKIFMIAALIGAAINLCLLIPGQSTMTIAIIRFLTGFSLAGIYPVGMKIAADYKKDGLGLALGFLVGALVLGTAFPHLLRDFLKGFSWYYVIVGISALSILGGLLIVGFVPNGPFRRRQTQFTPSTFLQGFKNKNFKAAAFGYFGHMWELYAFWAIVPLMLIHVYAKHDLNDDLVNWHSFLIIGIGALGCIAGGFLARRFSSELVSLSFLFCSLLCCIFSPFIFDWSLESVLLYLLIWGFFVSGDSPQFSTLVANFAQAENKGSALTIVNCIGFSITILSLFLIDNLQGIIAPKYIFLMLVPGPLIGCWAMLSRFFLIGKKV